MPTARMAVLGVVGLLLSAAPAGAATLVHHWKGRRRRGRLGRGQRRVWHGTREKAALCKAFEKWAILDSNQGPLPYQRSALTD